MRRSWRTARVTSLSPKKSLDPDPEPSDLSRIFTRVSKKAGTRARLRVVQSDAAQAWTDGDDVYVTTALLAQHDAHEVAGIVGHELAHITQRHIPEERVALSAMLAALGDDGVTGVVESVMAAVVRNVVVSAAQRYRSRTNEFEADSVGQHYAARPGYRPDGLAGALSKLAREHAETGWWDSHPATPERVAALDERPSRRIVIRIRRSR